MQICCHSIGGKRKIVINEDETTGDAFVHRRIIGNILYQFATIPYLMFVVSLLSRFMHSLSQIHMDATTQVLRYFKDIIIMIEKETHMMQKVHQGM